MGIFSYFNHLNNSEGLTYSSKFKKQPSRGKCFDNFDKNCKNTHDGFTESNFRYGGFFRTYTIGNTSRQLPLRIAIVLVVLRNIS